MLWPTCDMVSTGGRTPKTDTVLCARATRLDDFPKAREFADTQSKTRYGRLIALMTNNRDKNFGSAERYHFLPGFLDIPSLVVDFQALEPLSLATVKAFGSLGVLASPFAEHLSSRFDRYRGRIGTPDLDCDCLVKQPGGTPPARDNEEAL